ncbi:MAG TPA: GtrA family protein [Candidatus Paceibacterota bacterium]|jgi:putative flippase GtrA|nr:GtrA family protein [Candidatus Paceibacterota bacterium]
MDIFNRFWRYQFIRYVFSGGTAAALDVFILYALVTYFNVYYLAAATFAMTISFIARFLLQKFIAFQNEDKAEEKRQFAAYSILYFASLWATNAMLYFFVEKLRMQITLAQILAIFLFAVVSYFVYKFIIFRKKAIPAGISTP